MLSPLEATKPRQQQTDPLPSSQASLAEERRASGRVHLGVAAKLLGVVGTEDVRCTALDISEGGLYLQAPDSSGVSVGQRYEVVFPDGAGAPEPACLLGGGCFATVVRTERSAEISPSITGAGMRFDQPLIF